MGFYKCSEAFKSTAYVTPLDDSLSLDSSGNVIVGGNIILDDGYQLRIPEDVVGVAGKNFTMAGLKVDSSVGTSLLWANVKHLVVDSNGIILNASVGAKTFAKGPVVFVSTADQSITAVSDTILANAAHIKITSDAAYTLSSTPMIADGTDGQILTIENVGVYTITLSDETAVPGSNIETNVGNAIALGASDVVQLVYSTDKAAWCQLVGTKNI